MRATFHLHTPPPLAVAGSIPPRYETAEPVPYLRLGGERAGHVHEVLDRPATDVDRVRYPLEWARYLVGRWLDGKSVAPEVAARMEALLPELVRGGVAVEPEVVHADAVRRLAPPPPPVALPKPHVEPVVVSESAGRRKAKR